MRWRAASIFAMSLRAVRRPVVRSPVGFRRCAVSEVGMVLVGVLEILQRLLGHLEDVLPPIE